jgi:hypothetical protein
MFCHQVSTVQTSSRPTLTQVLHASAATEENVPARGNKSRLAHENLHPLLLILQVRAANTKTANTRLATIRLHGGKMENLPATFKPAMKQVLYSPTHPSKRNS